tara:strand:+ start:168 stop:614 length:447 start_codon:yes stop_codon:yes gene_type:complete
MSIADDVPNMTVYFISLSTNKDFEPDQYRDAAGKLANLLTLTLADKNVLKQVTHDANITAAKSEIEIALQENDGKRELVAEAVLDMQTEGKQKVKFDKAKFSKLLKSRPEYDHFPDMRIFKRAIPPEQVKGSPHLIDLDNFLADTTTD